MNNILKRILSIALVLVMCISMLSSTAFAVAVGADEEKAVSDALFTAVDNCGIRITTPPESVVIAEEESFELSVVAEYDALDDEYDNLTYLWEYNDPNTQDWKAADCFSTEYTGNTFFVERATAELDGYRFKCVITAPDGEFTESEAVTVTVDYTGIEKQYGILSYTKENGEIVITGCDKDAALGALIIPETIDGYYITKIRANAFKNSSLKQISIPATVSYIGEAAFEYCDSLDEIVFCHGADDELTIEGNTSPDGGGAFYNLSLRLSTCIYVQNVNSVNSAITGYDWDSSNRDVTYCPLSSRPVYGSFDNLMYEIKDGNAIIIGCDRSSTGSVYIPDNIDGYTVSEITKSAFSFCADITRIVIPKSVKTISRDAFNLADSVTDISVDPENENYCSIDGILYNKAKTELVRCPEGKTGTVADIPPTVTSVGPSAFQRSKITDIELPFGINQIGMSAFCRCEKLQNADIPDGVSVIENATFMYCSGLRSIYIPASVKLIDSEAFTGIQNDTEITFRHSADAQLTINEYAFRSSAFDTSITIKVPDIESINQAITGYDWAKSKYTVTYKEIEETENISILSQPESRTVEAGGSATLSVTAEYSGSGELRYLWKSYNKYTKQWEDANDFNTAYTNSTFTVNDVTLFMNDYKFKCVITSPNGTSVETDEVTITVTEVPAASTATLTVSSGTLEAGKTVTLSVSLSENSNAKMMQFTLLYDSAKLKLESCEAGTEMNDVPPTINSSTPGYIIFVWDDTTEYTSGASMLDITFSLADGAETVDKVNTVVSIATDSDSLEFHDGNLNKMNIETVDGSIEIVYASIGDINMDGKITVYDCGLIRHYVAGLTEFNETQKVLADVNCDGNVNVIDVNLVRRYVAKLIDEFPVG